MKKNGHRLKDRSSAEMPQWYARDRYSAARNLTAKGWLFQLAARHDALSAAKEWREDVPHFKDRMSVSSEEWPSDRTIPYIPSLRSQMKWDYEEAGVDLPLNSIVSTAFFDLITKDPVVTPARLSALEQPIRSQLTETYRTVDPFNLKQAMGVHQLTVEELFVNAQTLNMKARSNARAFFNDCETVTGYCDEEIKPLEVAEARARRFRNRKAQRIDGAQPGTMDLLPGRAGRVPYAPWMAEALDFHQVAGYPAFHTIISVDLSLPNGLLEMQFKNLIAELRIRHKVNEPQRHKSPDFEEWIRQGILPYLDLKLWGYLQKVKIPNRIIADLIYGSATQNEETIRKTTAKTAGQMTDPASEPFRWLAVSAGEESFDRRWSIV